MTQVLDAPGRGLAAEHARGVAVARDVERDVAVERLGDALAADALEIGVLRGADHLEARTRVRQVIGPFVVANLPCVRLQAELVVAQRLADVQIVAAALDDERLHDEDPVAAAHRGGRVGDDLLLRRLRAQPGRQQRGGHEYKAESLVIHISPLWSA